MTLRTAILATLRAGPLTATAVCANLPQHKPQSVASTLTQLKQDGRVTHVRNADRTAGAYGLAPNPPAGRQHVHTERARNLQDCMLAFIQAEHAAHRPAPSMKELVKEFNLSSTSVAQYHCKALVRRGLLIKAGRQVARGYVPTGAQEDAQRLRERVAALEARVAELEDEIAGLEHVLADPPGVHVQS